MAQVEEKKEQRPGYEDYNTPLEHLQTASRVEQYTNELENYPAFDRMKAMEEWRNGSKPFLEAIISNYNKPEPKLTPKQERKIRTASALTDGFTTLAELFAHSQGAYVRPRQGKSSTQNTNERLQKFQDRYEQDLMRYNSVLSEAERRDFSDYLKQAMDAHGQKRENILFKLKQAQYEAKAKNDAGEFAERKRQFDVRQAETERSNRAREAISRNTSSAREGKEGSKNVFEVPVSKDTQGAEFDQYTGKYYLKQHIPSERQISILANLPGGKQQYIIKNRLYKTYSYKDDFGNTREQIIPLSDAEIIKHYIENDFQQMQSARNSVTSSPAPPATPIWQLPKANISTSGKQPAGGKFDHSPY